MRITNNMMLKTTMSNIYGNKENVNTLNNQMSSQKKISRPSEDPVVAIRALRLRSNLSEINQYYEKNIPDAEAWLDVTETALNNMESILSDVRTQCTYGATGTLTADDRDAILKSLTQLREQLYAEGNTDYAGRTVFTGFRTNCNLTFDTEEKNTTYDITQTFNELDIEKEHRYYKGLAEVPTDDQIANGAAPGELERTDCDRIRLAYAGLEINEVTDENGNAVYPITCTVKNDDGTTTTKYLSEMQTNDGTNITVKKFATLEEWKNTINTGDFSDAVADNEVILVEDTGEMLLGKDVTVAIESNNYSLSVDYSKTGFAKGELRPEYYFNCTDVTDAKNPVEYQKFDEEGNELTQDINYIVAQNQTLTINTNAADVFNEDAGRDVDEMIEAVKYAMDAHNKIDRIDEMMSLEEYASEEDQAKLQEWKDAAEKEADYADDNLKKLFNTYIGNFDSYLTDVNLAITTVGSKGDQLALTETRMSNQQLTVTELKSSNEDRELSDIIIDYTSAYTAYEASLQAASKINQNTLLNYI
ncbi:MAG: flagellar hook-associated protein FlgL [Roseburia sp.]|nr:flagellar hook-associated protein FlgL [Roseburia sp.]